jgi:hypothetical protein
VGRGARLGFGSVFLDSQHSLATRTPHSRPPLRVIWNDEPTTGLNLLQKGLQESLAEAGVPVWHAQRSGASRWCSRVLAKSGLLRPLKIAGAPRHRFDKWEALLRKYGVKTAFFSARDAGAAMTARMPGLRAHWLPEACTLDRFKPGKPLAQRAIHLLEMGRKHPSVHPMLLEAFPRELRERHGVNHVYSRIDSSTPIYPTLDALYSAMGDTVMSVCFPKSITHNHGAIGSALRVETMTQRYLETIGSGALPVGACPAELKDLFGFDPVVSMDVSRPAETVREVLANLEKYQALADRSLRRLAEVGTFKVRAAGMLEIIERD